MVFNTKSCTHTGGSELQARSEGSGPPRGLISKANTVQRVQPRPYAGPAQHLEVPLFVFVRMSGLILHLVRLESLLLPHVDFRVTNFVLGDSKIVRDRVLHKALNNYAPLVVSLTVFKSS